jgi:hypothetical protein
LTRERFDTVKSKPQLAAALRATIETMQGGLTALEQRRDSVLGPNSGVELVNSETRDKIAKIQGVIDRLEGKAGAAPGGVQEGATATNPQTGAEDHLPQREMAVSELPPGFVLDHPDDSSLPPGFVMDKPSAWARTPRSR